MLLLLIDKLTCRTCTFTVCHLCPNNFKKTDNFSSSNRIACQTIYLQEDIIETTQF